MRMKIRAVSVRAVAVPMRRPLQASIAAVTVAPLLLVTMFVVLTLPGIGSANQLPVWFTILVISRDIAIVATVAVVNLAIGRRTFRPSIFGKIATATYVLTGVVTLYYNYLGQKTAVVSVFIYGSLAITLVSAFHYLLQVLRMGKERP